jgi:hypothetical protein
MSTTNRQSDQALSYGKQSDSALGRGNAMILDALVSDLNEMLANRGATYYLSKDKCSLLAADKHWSLVHTDGPLYNLPIKFQSVVIKCFEPTTLLGKFQAFNKGVKLGAKE